MIGTVFAYASLSQFLNDEENIMDSDDLFLLEAIVAVLPYVVVSTAGWLNNRVSSRRFGADAPV